MIELKDIDLNSSEFMTDNQLLSLRSILKEFKNHLKIGMNNAELQIGYYKHHLLVGHNSGGGKAYGGIEFDIPEEELLRIANKHLPYSCVALTVEVAYNQNNNVTMHAEMNIIRRVLSKIFSNSNGWNDEKENILYVAGDKYPCTKCQMVIHAINNIVINGTKQQILQNKAPNCASLERNGNSNYENFDKKPQNWHNPIGERTPADETKNSKLLDFRSILKQINIEEVQTSH